MPELAYRPYPPVVCPFCAADVMVSWTVLDELADRRVTCYACTACDRERWLTITPDQDTSLRPQTPNPDALVQTILDWFDDAGDPEGPR